MFKTNIILVCIKRFQNREQYIFVLVLKSISS